MESRVRNEIVFGGLITRKKEDDTIYYTCIPAETNVIEFLKRYHLLYTLCICTCDDEFRLTCHPAPGTEANVYTSPTRPIAWRVVFRRGWCSVGWVCGEGVVGGCGCPCVALSEIGLTSCMSGRPDLATITTRAPETPTRTTTRTETRVEYPRTGQSISKVVVVVFVVIAVITASRHG